ncbi:MAG: hypothetical protein AAFN30_15305, partial [Actinomycetota bacterium]
MAAITLLLLVTFSIQLQDPADSTAVNELPGPIVIEIDDPSIDADDPDLVDEMREIHDGFVAGESHSVIGPVTPDVPTAGSINTGMSVSYDVSFPAPGNVQTVVSAAAARWDEAVA